MKPPQTQNAPPQQSQNPAPQTQNPAPQTQNPGPGTQRSDPPRQEPSEPQSGEPSWPRNGQTNTPGEPTYGPGDRNGGPGNQTNAPANSPNNPPPNREGRSDLNPPSTQPPHQPYVPRRDVVTASAEIGGPGGDVQFNVVGRGAPPPPRERGLGWNDGPAPHHEPPGWVGPPPPVGWDGPPRPGGWNRPWDGPPRDVALARADFGPFNYDTFTVLPVFNWQYGGWGYWFFGVWVPLY